MLHLLFSCLLFSQIYAKATGPDSQRELLEVVRNSLEELDQAIQKHAQITKELTTFSDIVQKAIEGRKFGLSESGKATHLPPAEPFFWLRRQKELITLLQLNVASAAQVQSASGGYQRSMRKFLHSSYHVKSSLDTGCYDGEEECAKAATDDAGKAVLRLQDTYALTAEEMAQLGPRNSHYANFTLTLSDSFELGRTAYNNNIYPRCIQWMNLTVGLFSKADSASLSLSFNESEVRDFLSYCYFKTEDYDNAIIQAAKCLEGNPYNSRVKDNLEFFLSEQARIALEEAEAQAEVVISPTPASPLLKEEVTEEVTEEVQENEDYMSRYRRLCRLMLEENPYDLDQLKLYELPRDQIVIPQSPLWRLVDPRDEQCVYLSPKISAWERWRGVALEVLSVAPPLVIFHDFLTERETDETKATAEETGRLARSTVHDPATGKLIHADYRTSEGMFLYDKHLYPHVMEIERRIALLTALSLEAADDLQVAHYAPGGHYEPHVDMANQPGVIRENVGGNRIATFLIYLNDVIAGGATAFLEAKPSFVVRPRRGAALFWYNLGGPHGKLNLTENENGLAQPYEETIEVNTKRVNSSDYYQQPSQHGDNGIWETRHAACPVHSGVKWVANKWIREYPVNSHRYHYLWNQDLTAPTLNYFTT